MERRFLSGPSFALGQEEHPIFSESKEKSTIDTLRYSEYYGFPYVDLRCIDINKTPWDLLNEKFIKEHSIAPLFLRGNYLFLVTNDPGKQRLLKEIQFNTGLHTVLVLSDHYLLEQFIAALSEKQFKRGPETTFSLPEQAPSSLNDPRVEEAPVIKFVNTLIMNALNKKASDIHFELYEKSYRIRYRIDGILLVAASPGLHLAPAITSRIKIMANLNIAERRIPQDGRFKLQGLDDHGDKDFRVNICPTVNGEKVVIRILEASAPEIPLETLGFTSSQRELFLKSISKPQGMILVTGPTGSGKTLTLYTALNRLNKEDKNISTAEDPVEIRVPGLNQVHIDPKVGLTFATALRAFLRQDPDIIMVGEIRDQETAEIAIKAAQTGHLVLSTLHTNNTAETLTRLNNLGVNSFNIATSVQLIIAQRLLRKLCNYCKAPEHSSFNFIVYRPIGCEHCTGGYIGRVAIFEVMSISSVMQEHILNNTSSFKIYKQARSEGMLTLYEAGLEKIKKGITTINELHRVAVGEYYE